MKNEYFKTIVPVLILCGAAFAGDNLTVEKAVELMLKNNPLVQQSFYDKAAAQARLDQRTFEDWPLFGVEGKYAKLAPDPLVTFPGLGAFQFYPEDNFDVHAGVKYKLYDFGKGESAIKLSSAGLVQADNSVELTKTLLSFQTVQIFYNVIFLEQAIDAQQKEIESLSQYMEQTRKKVSIGSATDFDVLTIRVKVEEAKNQKMDFDNAYKKQMLALEKNLNNGDISGLKLEGKFGSDNIEINETVSVDLALKQRVEYRMAKQAEEIAKAQLGLAQNVNDPSLDLGALVGYKNGYLPRMDEWQLNWVLSAGVSIPLFDGFRASNQIKEANASLMAAKMKTEDVLKGIVTEIKQAISDVKTNYEKLKAAELHVKLAEDAVSQSKVRFENGVITNLDLINAETSLAKARLLHSQAQFSYVMSDYALKRASGMKIWKEATAER